MAAYWADWRVYQWVEYSEHQSAVSWVARWVDS